MYTQIKCRSNQVIMQKTAGPPDCWDECLHVDASTQTHMTAGNASLACFQHKRVAGSVPQWKFTAAAITERLDRTNYCVSPS